MTQRHGTLLIRTFYSSVAFLFGSRPNECTGRQRTLITSQHWHHIDLTIAASAPEAPGDPVGYVFEAKRTEHVVYLGTDNHIHELLWDRFGVLDPTGVREKISDVLRRSP